jgi:hypothetical protein
MKMADVTAKYLKYGNGAREAKTADHWPRDDETRGKIGFWQLYLA